MIALLVVSLRSTIQRLEFSTLNLERGNETADVRNWSSPTPFVEGLISVSGNRVAVSEKLQTTVVLFDAIHGAVEVSHLTLGAEDLMPKEISHAALRRLVSCTPPQADIYCPPFPGLSVGGAIP